MKTEGAIRVQLVHAWPDRYLSWEIELPVTGSVGDALAAAGQQLAEAGVDASQLSPAVFGKAVETRTRLRDGDRIELLRPLLLSPQQARSSRAAAARRGLRK